MISRFVDDYFIFATSKETIEDIEKAIKTCLENYNLTLNDAKKKDMKLHIILENLR